MPPDAHEESRLLHRHSPDLSHLPEHPPVPGPSSSSHRRPLARFFLYAALGLAVLVIFLALLGRHWLRSATRDSLPQISGTLRVPGLSASVTVTRDAHGIPSIHAATFDDLTFAQGFITAQDRLFQMDTLRRHAAGQLAEILGPTLIPHDRAQRILSLPATADRILSELPPDQLHAFERYSAGVNAEIAAASAHLPVEFRILAYTPRPWTPRDCALVSLILSQDLTNSFPTELHREALTARLSPSAPPELRAQLLADLYPVGSWRDHPPSQPATDLTTPVESIPDIPLDDSQVRLHRPSQFTASPHDLLALSQLFAPLCPACRAGSNNWALSGAHTASGRPILSNDMHLSLTAPGIWYTVDLRSDIGPTLASTSSQDAPFHAAGVSVPGVPFIVSGHNDHVAWGFTNLGADVQDLYLEHLRSSGLHTEFQTPAGAWLPVTHRAEVIRVRGANDVLLDVQSTTHGDASTPLITPLLPSETRPIALRWTLFTPGPWSLPFHRAAAAPDAAALIQAFRAYTGPSLNLIAADDSGHITYHAIGAIPVRGSLASPSPISPVPTDATAPDAALHEWAGTIPFDQLPSTTDPAGGLLVTANSRVTPDNFDVSPEPASLPGLKCAAPPSTRSPAHPAASPSADTAEAAPQPYPFPITLNWADPYRNERIWRLLSGTTGLKAESMLRVQTDVFSVSDQLIAHRFAYAIDHTPDASRRLRQAADLLRSWNGEVLANTPAPAIDTAARRALWTLLLTPRLSPAGAEPVSPHRRGPFARTLHPASASSPATSDDPSALYTWGERNFAQEAILAHQPARWLPPAFPDWNALLTAAVDRGLSDANAPSDLSKWRYGRATPTEIELPLFAQSLLLRHLIGLATGTPPLALPGNGVTVRQTHPDFGPSERLSVDLADPAAATLNLPLGESGNPSSPFFLDQLPAYLHGKPMPLPFSPSSPPAATLTLSPN